jgi:hypothetical protein
MIANRIDWLRSFTVFDLARAYFGNGDLISLFSITDPDDQVSAVARAAIDKIRGQQTVQTT